MTIKSTGYWTFFCNPKKWEIDRFLETNPEEDTYQITPWQTDFFFPGQLGVIRVGIDSRTKENLNGRSKLTSGIYAIVEVVGGPRHRNEKPDKFWAPNGWTKKEGEKLVVDIRYLKNLYLSPILLSTLKENESTSIDKYLISGFQASSMPLTQSAFDEIIKMQGDDTHIFNKVENESSSTLEDIVRLNERYKNAAPEVKNVISQRIERGAIASKVKAIYGYKCKMCEALNMNPLSFIKSNGEHYIETHHIFQVSNLEIGSLGLLNLITLCANHHREFHYGNVQIISNDLDNLVVAINNNRITIKKYLSN